MIRILWNKDTQTVIFKGCPNSPYFVPYEYLKLSDPIHSLELESPWIVHTMLHFNYLNLYEVMWNCRVHKSFHKLLCPATYLPDDHCLHLMERRPVESIEYKVRRRVDRDAPTHLPLHEPAQVLRVRFLELPLESLQPRLLHQKLLQLRMLHPFGWIYHHRTLSK